MSFEPTDEQKRAVALALTGKDLAIKALAGTGKTSTLRLIAEAMGAKTGQYIAFNKAIVTDAQGTFPTNIVCSTAHSLAFQAIGKNYAGRLKGRRMKPQDMADKLGLTALQISVDGKTKRLAPGYLAGLVKRAVDTFCQTADERIDKRHVPYVDGIDQPHADGRRSYYNNDKVREHVAPALARYWADVEALNGSLPFSHGCYLKLWQLSKPTIHADFILYDEAQDANPCMLSIVAQQKGRAQLIYVGDDYQQIYAWNGAVNALGSVGGEVAYLTQSFRFGDEIARAANHALSLLSADVEVRGTPTITSSVGAIEIPVTILCRTNAAAVANALNAIKNGRKVALVGGADEVVRFAEAADSLREKGWTSHPDLACFSSWSEVKDYVDNDPSGTELKLLVKLIDDFGTEAIIAGLGRCTSEASADLVVSTAHKSKGREWPEVVLAGDFPDPEKREAGDEELRLLYVAITRAKLKLDIRSVKLMAGFKSEPDEPVPDGAQSTDTAPIAGTATDPVGSPTVEGGSSSVSEAPPLPTHKPTSAVERRIWNERDRLVCAPEKGGCGEWRPVDKLHSFPLSQVVHICGQEEWLIPEPLTTRGGR